MLGILMALLTYPLVPNAPGDFCTPKDPDFIEYRYEEEIPYCQRNVSGETKDAIYRRYGIPASDRKEYTIDHIIPLSLGGSNSVDNLWPEHKSVKAKRPKLETQLYVAIRDGEINHACAIWIVRKAKYELTEDWECP